MKSERKQKVQRAMRFFREQNPIVSTAIGEGLTLVEEVRRLRRELKEVNKVNERYSRALGFHARKVPAGDHIESLEKQIFHLNESLRQAEDEIEHWKNVAAEKSREVAKIEEHEKGPTASKFVDSTTGRRLKKSEEGESAVLNDVIQRSLSHADRILREARWELDENECPRATFDKIEEALAVIRGISKTIES